MKHSLDLAFIIIITISVIGMVGLLLVGPGKSPEVVGCTMDALMCPDGTTVGRIGPSCEFAPCPTSEPASLPDLITVTSPLPGDTITSPVTITGMARGYWFFEASFPISVVNWDGLIIGEGIATAEGDWMTEDFVPFTATVNFTFDPETPYKRGALILRKDNPSGLPENDNALEFPIQFQ